MMKSNIRSLVDARRVQACKAKSDTADRMAYDGGVYGGEAGEKMKELAALMVENKLVIESTLAAASTSIELIMTTKGDA